MSAEANGEQVHEVWVVDRVEDGVATLVEAMQVARRQGGKIILCAMQERVQSIFEIARLDMVFTIVGDTEEAMAT